MKTVLDIKRKPDFVIGHHERPYILRWYLIPQNRRFNIYYHRILRSDDDRALHDHPWPNMTLVLSGCYVEYLRDEIRFRYEGDFVFRRATTPHRIVIPEGGYAETLFFTGPNIRQWGFWCPQGWRHWKEFVDPNNSGLPGPGCN